MHENLPKDFSMQISGNNMAVCATVRTQEELRGVIWALECMAPAFPSHRKAVHGDFGLLEPAPPSYRDKLVAAGLDEL